MLLFACIICIRIQSAMAQTRAKNTEYSWISAHRNTTKGAKSAGGVKVARAQKQTVPKVTAKTSKDKSPVSGKVKPNDRSGAKDKISGAEETTEKDPGDKESAVDEVSVAVDVSGGARFEVIAEDPSDFHYVGSEKSDPFLPPLITNPEGVKTSGTVLNAQPGSIEIPIVSPLQQYDLNQLNLVGVWQLTTGERKAMILAPANNGGAGQGIIVKVGDPVGNRGGKITSIGEEYVNVREFMLAPDGSRRYLDQKMQMGKKEVDDLPRKIRFTPGAAHTTLVKENQTDFEKIMDEERKKKNPDAALPDRDQTLTAPPNAPLNTPVVAPVAAPEATGAADVPAAAEEAGVMNLEKMMVIGGEAAKAGLESLDAGQQHGQANGDERATTAFHDPQTEKAPEAAPKVELQDKAPAAAASTVRKVF